MMNIKEKPVAYADIRGNKNYPDIKGRVDFYDTYGGTVLAASVHGLPEEAGKRNPAAASAEPKERNHSQPGKSVEQSQGFHAFHIHTGNACMENGQGEFASAGGHYNPWDTLHPSHAGDLPPLLSNNGSAWMAVYTGRFYPEDVIGRTVIIHEKSDDFHTQPSGDAGEMIACGEIVAWDSDNYH